jgi:hypothetical protein
LKNIVIVKLNGGLGNQMFQYALAKVVAIRHNAQILLDKDLFNLTEKKPGHTPREYELDIFNIDSRDASNKELVYFERLSIFHKLKRELHLNYPKMCYEANFSYSDAIKNKKPPVYLRGFFQSYRYFSGYEEVVRDCFQFPEAKMDGINKNILNSIKTTKSIAVHIRRGDYKTDKITNNIHGVCSLEYYQKAMEMMIEMNYDATFYFFSDDMEWVKSNFGDYNEQSNFVSGNNEDDSWKDMMLMSNCDHNIIANSSFSWWAAWLNNNKDKKVIAPKRWFRDEEKESYTYDLIPPQWIRI